MADTKPFQAVTLYDSFSVLDGGMNSGVTPLLLKKNQTSFATNLTVRQGFATNRPIFDKNLTITYPSAEVENAIKEGLFQGACYYQPDSGNQSLFLATSGRLFQFQIEQRNAVVTERTIAGDPNPASLTQAWLWQSENFLIWNDGQNLPVFFDGASSRRSYGPSYVVATMTGGPYTIPEAGETFPVTLTAPYTGEFNIPVLINGEYYQPIENASGYAVSAFSLFDVPATPIPVGTPVYIKPSVGGVVLVGTSPSGSFTAGVTNLSLTFTAPWTGPFLGLASIFGKTWQVISTPGTTVTFIALENGTLGPVPAGTQIPLIGYVPPNVLVGTVTVADAAPAIGGTIALYLSSAFAGTPGQVVYIGATGQYQLTAIPPTPPGTTLTLINLTGAAGGSIDPSMPGQAEILSVPELPAGRMGAYGLGQNWVSLVDGLSYIVSDISRGPSGTQAYNFRDAVLKTTGLTFLGGNFAIPGAGNVITSLTFTANLDLSLGQGSLQVGTAQFMASNIAPFDWQNPPAERPLLTFSLIGTGPLAQDSTIRVNSDVYFRSVVGLGSLVQARRDFNTPGNTPISEEVVRILDLDDQTLLGYGSAINFDNRVLQTVSPQASSQGVLHAGMVVQNLDPVSGITGKLPPVYDGLWTGLNVLKLVTGIFGGVQRAFAFTFNISTSQVELYELMKTGEGTADNGIIPIVWGFETAALFNADVKEGEQRIRLTNGELAIDNVVGRVNIEVFYRPDQYGGDGESSCWVPWHTTTICAASGSKPLYFPRIGFGEPKSSDCDAATKQPLREGYTFQLKFRITGSCRVIRCRVQAVTVPEPKFPPPKCTIECS